MLLYTQKYRRRHCKRKPRNSPDDFIVPFGGLLGLRSQ
jgi:hypothetical protein